MASTLSFDLVIEVLLISRALAVSHRLSAFRKERSVTADNCFHLVIEVLLVSSEQRSGTGTRTNKGCFHLVIEVLLVSRYLCVGVPILCRPEFQSRNRGSFGFKIIRSIRREYKYFMFQSRNRGSFGFKSDDASDDDDDPDIVSIS